MTHLELRGVQLACQLMARHGATQRMQSHQLQRRARPRAPGGCKMPQVKEALELVERLGRGRVAGCQVVEGALVTSKGR